MADRSTTEPTKMPLSIWGVMWSEDTSDDGGSLIWEESVGGTVDLS